MGASSPHELTPADRACSLQLEGTEHPIGAPCVAGLPMPLAQELSHPRTNFHILAGLLALAFADLTVQPSPGPFDTLGFPINILPTGARGTR